MSECFEAFTWPLSLMLGCLVSSLALSFVMGTAAGKLRLVLYHARVDAMRPIVPIRTPDMSIDDIGDLNEFKRMGSANRLALREMCEIVIKNLDATSTME